MKQTTTWAAAILFGAALALTGAPQAAYAEWPEQPITFIVPYPAGGAVDLFMRKIAPDLGKTLGQPVAVENISGAGGGVGTAAIANAQPDGYTLGLAHAGPLAINLSLYKSVPYKSPDDFTPITMLGAQQNMIVVNPKSEIHTVQDIIDKAKADPGALKVASGGNGTGSFLGASLFSSKAGVSFLNVPYKGNGPAVLGLLSGETEVMFPSVSSVLEYLKSGQLRGIAVTTQGPVSALPDLPTVAAVVPDCCDSVWFGVMGPAGLDPKVVAKVHDAVVGLLESPGFAKAMDEFGINIQTSTPEELKDYIVAQQGVWKTVIEEAGITPQ
jgi:tripartite-type tricarboxylate transporter receptor subunit TctC